MRSLNATTAVTPEATTREIAAAPPSSVGAPGPISTIVIPRRGAASSSASQRRRLIHDVSGPERKASDRCPSSARCATSWSTPRSTSGRMPLTPSSVAIDAPRAACARRAARSASSARRRGREHESVDRRHHPLDRGGLALARLLRLRDDERVPGIGRGVLRPAHDAEDHRVRDVGDEEAERVRATRRQRPGDRVDAVVQLLRGQPGCAPRSSR